MTRINIIIAVAVAALSISIWAFVNQPETEPAWPLEGLSFATVNAGLIDPIQNTRTTLQSAA